MLVDVNGLFWDGVLIPLHPFLFRKLGLLPMGGA